MSGRPRIAIVAGEASGDQLGAGLIAATRRLRPEVEFVGIAGPAMRAAGCEAWFATEELSVMGLAEVLRHLPRLARLKRSLTQRLRAHPPVAYVGIDAPDFNLRVEEELRAAGLPTVQYVCPSVWAWRRRRVRVLRRACDRVLCLLPFEVEFLSGSGVSATFVGHPFADQVAETPDREAARRVLGLSAERIQGLQPGSRVGEVTRLGPAFLDAARLLQDEFPGIECVAPMATPAVRREFEAQLARGHGKGTTVHLVDGHARDALAASELVLAASGTVTLEAMLLGTPMVVAYRFTPLTYALARALVQVRHFALPNLVAGEPLVPELLQNEVTAARLAGEAAALLRSPARRQALRERFLAMHRALRRGASERAARAVLEVAGLA
jgi:lipid-A-disaccharide synthase